MTHDTLNQKKSPMTMTSVVTDWSVLRSTDMHLLHEALSRARMQPPLEEASRSSSARRVAMRARAQQARELGESPEQPAR